MKSPLDYGGGKALTPSLPGSNGGYSAYSCGLLDGMQAALPAAYSVWGSSDSSQLYAAAAAAAGTGNKKTGTGPTRNCSAVLIATATLVLLGVLAIAAVAAYLGGSLTTSINNN